MFTTTSKHLRGPCVAWTWDHKEPLKPACEGRQWILQNCQGSALPHDCEAYWTRQRPLKRKSFQGFWGNKWISVTWVYNIILLLIFTFSDTEFWVIMSCKPKSSGLHLDWYGEQSWFSGWRPIFILYFSNYSWDKESNLELTSTWVGLCH